MEKKLSELIPGQRGIIKSVGGDGLLRRRLLDMGVTPGAEVAMRKRAPLGDPLEVTLRGYELTLRNAEAEKIIAEVKDA